MLRRCYDLKFKSQNLTYKDCYVCEEWLRFSNFKAWFDENYIEGYELDKDILIKGNKVYSPNTVCFVPHEINSLFVKSNRLRGKYPIGVHKNTYRDRYRSECGNHSVGTFATPIEAFNAYKIYKEKMIQEIANAYYKDNRITKNVFDALLAYKVEITD